MAKTITNEAKNEVALSDTLVPSTASIEGLRSLPAAQRIAALQSITSYIGADVTNLDAWIGKEMPIKGVVIHDATVGVEEIDKQTGEIGRGYTDVQRVVFKLDGHQGVGAVSMSAESFAKTFLIPVFGFGDFMEDGKPVVVNVLVGQKSKGDRRTFTFQVK